MRRILVSLLLLLCLAQRPAMAALGAAAPADPCREAARGAERSQGIPDRLLVAIARVESGRVVDGAMQPWPWTINAEGVGHYYASKQEAIDAVRDLQARGVRSIDVGCLQVNLMHHPNAFATLDDAFDPARNADYAARFLNSLKAQANAGSWLDAAGTYHSATPEQRDPYRVRVADAWAAEGGSGDGAGNRFAGVAPRGAIMLGNAGMHPRVMPGAATGRGLAAYRAMPVLTVRRQG